MPSKHPPSPCPLNSSSSLIERYHPTSPRVPLAQAISTLASIPPLLFYIVDSQRNDFFFTQQTTRPSAAYVKMAQDICFLARLQFSPTPSSFSFVLLLLPPPPTSRFISSEATFVSHSSGSCPRGLTIFLVAMTIQFEDRGRLRALKDG